jgi:hypothetical protein
MDSNWHICCINLYNPYKSSHINNIHLTHTYTIITLLQVVRQIPVDFDVRWYLAINKLNQGAHHPIKIRKIIATLEIIWNYCRTFSNWGAPPFLLWTDSRDSLSKQFGTPNRLLLCLEFGCAALVMMGIYQSLSLAQWTVWQRLEHHFHEQISVCLFWWFLMFCM